MKKAPNTLAKVLELYMKHCYRDHPDFDESIESVTAKSFYAGAGTKLANIVRPRSVEVTEFIRKPDGQVDDNLTCAYFYGMEAVPVLMAKVDKFDDKIKLKFLKGWIDEAAKGIKP